MNKNEATSRMKAMQIHEEKERARRLKIGERVFKLLNELGSSGASSLTYNEIQHLIGRGFARKHQNYITITELGCDAIENFPSI